MTDKAQKLSNEALDAIWERATAKPPLTVEGAISVAHEATQDRVDLLAHIAAVQVENGAIALDGMKLMREIQKLQEARDAR